MKCRSKRLVLVLFAVLALPVVTGCGGGGGGGSASTLHVLDAVVADLGELPIEGLFLNSEIEVRFSAPLDPASVSTQTFRVLVGPSFTQLADGTIEIDRDVVRFRPRLPTRPDLSDAGFAPDTEYRLVLRGLPDLNTIRSTNGKPLQQTRTFLFTTRFDRPYYFDPVLGPPRLSAVWIDLDGNDQLDADGDPATEEAEEFFEGEVTFDRFDPFVFDVRTGSAGLPSPNPPLQIALLFDEAIDPSTLFVDEDFDELSDRVAVVDLTNPYECDDPNPGDRCPRVVRYEMTLEEAPPLPGTAFARSLIRLRIPRGLAEVARHRLVVASDVTDLNGNRLPATLNAVFETGVGRPRADVFFDDFSTTRRRGSGTTALWNPALGPFLMGGIGFGGDGSDGPLVVGVLDTRQNDGVFNFSAWATTFDVEIRGPNPATIRVYEDITPTFGTIQANGRPGQAGQLGDLGTLPGGEPGPGGRAGGRSGLLDGHAGGDGQSPPRSEGEGHGGLSGNGPGAGGGGGHRTIGQRGNNGGEQSGGEGGERYGDVTGVQTIGGSGGGGGGSDTIDDDTPIASGGSGGGGGGVIRIEGFDTIILPRFFTMHANAGNGGSGVSEGGLSGAGGGGSGGSILIRARTVWPLSGFTEAKGGPGGSGVIAGGAGSPGRIRVEDMDADTDCFRCNPDPIIGGIPPEELGESVAPAVG